MPKRRRDEDEEEESAVESDAVSEVSDRPAKKSRPAKKPQAKEKQSKKPKASTEQESKDVDGIAFNVTGEDSWVDLGTSGKKRLTVRTFKGKRLIDIREFYEDKGSGEMKPGKKGISLSTEEWHELARISESVSKLISGLE
ncbi:hypothetical protein M408DRAFT_175563 [Serendipita vermifera MAFF 305830]|uniref:Transcriptional coactivator p15 (PC4) C-terminal domain-containing protein n=1 Tax=Serendipita vermifera MAFF 305830 TaxID=933852 RepID=A0A0C3B429_SERVB|nr:hypothetical protein M408DRAFT_175563 [Serendipita vermifera MAFF 305830]